MGLSAKVDEQIMDAMKKGEATRLSVLRLLKSAVKYYQVEKKLAEVSDTDFLSVVRKQIKQRQDSVEAYKQGARDELVAKEQEEIRLLEQYLPPSMSESDLEKIVKDTLQELGVSSKKEMGRVMKAVSEKVAGRADGKMVSQIVQRNLA
jgi:uncharacterized protein YqeY